MDESYEVAHDGSKRDIYRDEIPMALCMVNSVAKQPSQQSYVVLFDSGSSTTWWNVKSLPPGASPRRVETTACHTLAGNMSSSMELDLEEITFPEFFRTRQLGKITARVFTAECRYDAIIGRDVLQDMGLKMDFKNNKMSWDECHVPFKVFDQKLGNPYGLKEPSVPEQLFMKKNVGV